ncbi:hypothetical protein ACTFIZ_005256 [Dictyostelium cf. discoideum]
MKKDHEINIDYIQISFHKPHFEWCYKAINYDLTRSFSCRNLIALILHQIWIWICNQLYSEEKLLDSTLDYDNILKKWYKSASLEYIKKIKNFKIASSKDILSICDRNNYIKNIKNIKKQIVKEYCIPVSVLPNRVVVEQFI